MGFYKDINKNLAFLREYMARASDCKLRRIYSGNTECAVVFTETAVSQQLLEQNVIARLMHMAVRDKDLDQVRRSATSAGQITVLSSLDQAPAELAGGMTLLFVDGVAGCLSVDVRKLPSRSVEEPAIDKTILGARDGFTESVGENLGLIRKRIRSELLGVRTVFAGSGKTKCYLLWMDDDMLPLVEKLTKTIEKLDGGLCLTVRDILPAVSPRSVFPTQKVTERPDTVCSLLPKGRVVLLMDGQPVAVCFPTTLWELFESPNDASIASTLARAMTLLRFIGALLCITLPGLYVALLNYNRALLPPEVTALVIEAESKIALSLLPEVLITWVLVALIFQVGVALPSTVGGTIGIFGSIVLGQALVTAGVASEMTLLVVITSSVSGYSVPNYPLNIALRHVSLIVLLFSAALGLIGTGLALVALFARLLALTSASYPYLPIRAKRGCITADELALKMSKRTGSRR